MQKRNDDNLQCVLLASKCTCGADARIRYRIPVTWVECKKKCGMKTGFFPDCSEQYDPDSQRQAVEAWNRMVKKHG